MAFSYLYNWSSTSDQNDWTFINPASEPQGLYTNFQRRRWCISSGNTPSTGVGPTTGNLTGSYIYTEASSPASLNDQFILEFNNILDAARHDITINFFTNQRGDRNDSTCTVQTNENNSIWTTRAIFGGSGDITKVPTNGVDIWAPRTVPLIGIVSAPVTRIRFVVQIRSTSSVWHSDYGLDTISILGIDKLTLFQTHQMIL